MVKKLNEQNSEAIEKNFLSEDCAGLPNQTVHVYKEIPKMVKGVFINNRDPGVALMFHYKSKTHPLHHYTLYHGVKTELPEEIVFHLEGMNDYDPYSCHRRLYGRKMNEDAGTSETYVNGYSSNFQFKRMAA